jgi:hypothetical protein
MSHLMESGELSLEDVREAEDLLKSSVKRRKPSMMVPLDGNAGMDRSVDAASLAIDSSMCGVMAVEPDAAAQCGANAVPAMDACVD